MYLDIQLQSFIGQFLLGSVVAPLLISCALLITSLLHFGRTGPAIKDEVLSHFVNTLVYGLARLTFWAFIVLWYWAAWGGLIYSSLSLAAGVSVSWWQVSLFGLISIGAATSMRFLWVLFYSPATISTSFNYANSRLCAIWRHLTPIRLKLALSLLTVIPAVLVVISIIALVANGKFLEAVQIVVAVLFLMAIVAWAVWEPTPNPSSLSHQRRAGTPNIVMIGSDTLRADRVGSTGYARSLTPFIDTLLINSVNFTNCYVPCARTAPSVASMFTASWPHRHGIRDNFVADDAANLPIVALPKILKDQGWKTAVVADWSGSDLGKFNFGFEEIDVPGDQWNLRYLLRQGPKDLRLFLSLFGHNRWCKKFLPEIYFLAGVPLNRQVTKSAQRMINKLAKGDQPFFLNVFMAATHPPFGSEHPYYNLFSDPQYLGDSKFVMEGLADPFDIIRRQGEPREEFDLDQIIDLYDGCVRSFDDEVKKIIGHLDACGLRENTIVVIYSDHGFEFFEHDTWGQGNSALGEASPKIPLIISASGLNVGLTVDKVVRSIDIAPTLLEMVGIKPPAGWNGVSLMQYLTGDSADLNLAAYNETGIWLTQLPGMHADHVSYPNLMDLLEIPDKISGTMAIKPEYQKVIVQAKDRMLRVGKWKLVCQPLHDCLSFKLFDLQADPHCLRDVSSNFPDEAENLKQILQLMMAPDFP